MLVSTICGLNPFVRRTAFSGSESLTAGTKSIEKLTPLISAYSIVKHAVCFSVVSHSRVRQ